MKPIATIKSKNGISFKIEYETFEELASSIFQKLEDMDFRGDYGSVIVEIEPDNACYWDFGMAHYCFAHGRITETEFVEMVFIRPDHKVGNKSEQETNYPINSKTIMLARYCGEFQSATEATATIRKSSEEIKLDLRPMADFSTNEISEYLITLGYSIGFDDTTPVWLMQSKKPNELPE